MNTLNSIAENIAFKLGKQFNDTLLESIKLDVIQLRSLFIRRDLERNPLNYLHYLQGICIEMEMVDAAACAGLQRGCYILQSKKPIPKSVRLKSNGRADLHFVGDVYKSNSFVFSTANEMKFSSFLPLQSSVIYYGFDNGYLQVFNNLHQKKVLVEYVIDNPREIDDCRYSDTFPDDLEFLLPSDMITDISNMVLKLHRDPIKKGEEVNIDKDA